MSVLYIHIYIYIYIFTSLYFPFLVVTLSGRSGEILKTTLEENKTDKVDRRSIVHSYNGLHI